MICFNYDVYLRARAYTLEPFLPTNPQSIRYFGFQNRQLAVVAGSVTKYSGILMAHTVHFPLTMFTTLSLHFLRAYMYFALLY